ncbi:hypothetical protein M378DRAFT_360655 [Amanita muscaria Koide BX008]|uniref:Uncharacterized protein n=1 Tax=Amanita muscaria (strain Koide BX008) TaxID=946122 RepID=A0A0C2SUN8_AMAMK|nr:hypothetical protein M378DRAFT_360655 [Amanita muscaria Koide BX008]
MYSSPRSLGIVAGRHTQPLLRVPIREIPVGTLHFLDHTGFLSGHHVSSTSLNLSFFQVSSRSLCGVHALLCIGSIYTLSGALARMDFRSALLIIVKLSRT